MAFNDYNRNSNLDPNLLFAGQYYDSESGLAYNRFRYYDPESGNYICSDPIGLEGGSTPYFYVQNPLDWVDLFGLAGCPRTLRDNMLKANKELANQSGVMNRAWHKEKGSAAHHIVAGSDARAQTARDILAKHNIDINDARNGIFLKHISKTSKQAGAYHRNIHTNKYYDNVNRILTRADKHGKDAVEKALNKLRDDLLFDKNIY
ncbi:RHS repeat-associated core domain-containing protein [Avibacterium avium]|uniref:RHS repeat-associated core domain-containing protein n=1 Tax=Avibacterium avium TaxID=751 RepID=UPI003BF8BC9D